MFSKLFWQFLSIMR